MTAVVIIMAALMIATTGGMMWLAGWAKSEVKENKHARDLINNEHALAEQYKSDRDVAVQERDVARAELEREKSLRVIAEKQRDGAAQLARDYLVKRIEQAKIADAAHLVRDLLAGGFERGGVLATVPQADDSPAKDGVGAADSLSPSSVTRGD